MFAFDVHIFRFRTRSKIETIRWASKPLDTNWPLFVNEITSDCDQWGCTRDMPPALGWHESTLQRITTKQ